MSSKKFVLKSRAFWATLAPILAVVFQQTGLGEAVFGEVRSLAEGTLTALGAGAYLLHHFSPDLRPKTFRPGKGSGLSMSLLVIAVALPFVINGCATSGGDSGEFTRAQCDQGCSLASLGVSACPAFITGEDADAQRNREICQQSVQLAVAACHFGCGFVDAEADAASPPAAED